MKSIKRTSGIVLGALATLSLFSLGSTNVKASTKEYKNTVNNITDLKNLIDNNITKYFNDDLVYALPSQIENDDLISVIVSLDEKSLYDEYKDSNSKFSMSDYATSATGVAKANRINNVVNKNLSLLAESKIKYSLGETYDTLLAGFEVEIKAKDFDRLAQIYPTANLILGDVYEKCETEVVTNDVNVYETGIFDSSSCEYQGDGVVVAVLDTGLDYTHTAFSPDNFITSKEAFTLDYVKTKVGSTTAATFTSGLTGEDVYVNKKVPYAYDYADKDADVAPINSEHGTHVAGIIAGKDQTITGVAPNAQLAIFKVFSDHSEGAKQSWLIAALEDCVVMGVDVINMSLGSSCGFTREVDKEAINVVYDKVREAGIGLMCAASNDNTATQSSKKNGNNSLTSNPDFGTVGSPATYDGALSVASVDGVKTSYLSVANQIIYFTEASTNSADVKKSFVDDILATLGTGEEEHEFDYVQIPGVGRSSDYPEEDSYYEGKIVLVKRGQTTFEDKVRVALIEKGAAGIIIYNNVSGSISMAVGANIGAVCSLSQDDGEFLISKIDKETKVGKLSIKKSQVAGPFMSDFSSWGPTSDLKIKPEITAHGGQIYSAIPGQGYERLSGTSMACPNMAGAAALIYQYVKYSGVFGTNLSANEVTDIANQLVMSTADIVYDKNGLPSAVRKQGAGLVSIDKSTTSEAYISTYDKKNNKMNKAKFELGDDKNRTGVYEMKFAVNNLTSKDQTYDLSVIALTEGVSTTYTSHGETTVTNQAYKLSGAKVEVVSATGAEVTENSITVSQGSTATISIKVTLSDEDKAYLNKSFENGMYVEGFICLTAKGETKVSLNVPFLGFYGDWTEAPIFDEEYYDTNVDEINAGIDEEDKLMEDAYATRVIGGLYSDYISTLGTYYFVQDPKNTQIAASKDKIAVSNQNIGESGSTISSIRSVNAGLLRNAKNVYVQIVEESTGELVYTKLVTNQRKSSDSGSTIYASSIDIEYDIMKNELRNNTRYICKLTAFIDWEGEQHNKRNTFTFPFYVDFEAPIVTDCVYRTEYDRSSQKTSLYADLYIYDNHYTMGAQIGQITRAPEGSQYTFTMNSFGKYVTPVYSEYNSTSVVTINLTDYIADIKNSCGIKYNTDGTSTVLENTNTFIVNVYDYAMNSATYEISLPDDINYMYFEDDDIKLSPNETLDLTKALKVYPTDSWIQTLDFESTDDEIITVVNNVLVAKKNGTGTITAKGYNADGELITATLNVTVLAPGDEGYVNYSVPEISKFEITGYETVKAYYAVNSSDREIGVTGGKYDFGDTITLSMFPSETVKIEYVLDSYFPNLTDVQFKTSNSKIATVTEDGTITAQVKGNTTVMANVLFDGKTTLYSAKITIKVKEPFDIMSIYLQSYKGLGGTVTIPGDRGITTINQYAFSNYEYVDKDLEAGDVIDEEDPYYIKQMYIGEDTITKVIIPEGVTTINQYAFANLTALEEVVLPSTLTRIGVGAFYNCTALKKINLENVKFINEKAFANCPLEELNFASTVSIGTYAFQNCKLASVVLPACAQSLSEGAFADNELLTSVQFKAKKMKIATNVFGNCKRLASVNINASVIPSGVFAGCTELTDVTFGADVAVIGEGAFSNTNVSAFKVSPKNPYLTLEADGALVLKDNELILSAPNYVGASNTITSTATKIGNGAFTGNKKVFTLVLPNVTEIGDYAFYSCTNLRTVEMPNVEVVGKYAFANTKLTTIGILEHLTEVGEYAFCYTSLEDLSITDGVKIGNRAFALNTSLKTVTIGNNVEIGEYAFYCPVTNYTYENTESLSHYELYNYDVLNENGEVVKTYTCYRYKMVDGANSALEGLVLGNNVKVGANAFNGNVKLANVTLGENAVIGSQAFYSCSSLNSIDLSNAKSIGDYAFSGARVRDIRALESSLSYALDYYYENSKEKYTGYIYSCFGPQFTSVDLTNVESVGKGVFAGNNALTTVTLSATMTEIGSQMFANCNNLVTITLNENIKKIGDQAFYLSGIKNIDLTNVEFIGENAFAGTKLEAIEFGTDVVIDNSAFSDCAKLVTVDGSEYIAMLGDYAFYKTSLTSILLDNCSHIGTKAFANSSLEKVVFGEALVSLGENPFAYCPIETFGLEKEVIFNGTVVDVEYENDYKLNDYVFVSSGVLYRVVNNGYELVSYPTNSSFYDYEVLDNTVRISDYAFAASGIENVVLSQNLAAIGAGAFYECDYLLTVTFKSYNAPLLEEEYDASYATPDSLPLSGNVGSYTGLGISKYYMWNASSDMTNFYYGNNFTGYIGKLPYKFIMVKPVNGKNYDSFIFSQYFGTAINGSTAPTSETLNVISLINKLPNTITLDNEALVKAVRQAYDNIALLDQKSLVNNLETLEKAESTIEYLKSQQTPAPQPVEPEVPAENGFAKFMKNNWVGLVIALIILLAAITVVVILLYKLKAYKGEASEKEKEKLEEKKPEEKFEVKENSELDAEEDDK